jgi:uncharacterized protein YoxC
VSAGDWALLILAIFWAVLVVVIAAVSTKLFQVLDSTREMIDGVREETVPILREARTTVTTVNRNLDHADTIIVSAGKITHNVERISTLVDQFVSLPLIKAISWAYGFQKGAQRFRGES